MARVGRNDPCPCGSGRKHKHCCLPAGNVVEIHGSGESGRPWRRMREAEGRLISRMLDLGIKTSRQRGRKALGL